jgi:hypothetical protein
VLEAHWREPGFTVPNATTYPWQWLWDSCFHAVVWAELGEADRAISELRGLFARQHETGFVPHMTYWEGATEEQAQFWGKSGVSTITQPPMYGHAIAELGRRSIEVPPELVEAAGAGLRHLLRWRARIDGLVCVVHPWETGCDDSPRWDAVGVDLTDSWNLERWKARKGALVESIERAPGFVPIGNPDFPCAPVGFNALVAWNAHELAGCTDDDELHAAADELATTIATRWDEERVTWIDAGAGAETSGRVRTLDALLPLLVTDDAGVAAAVGATLTDPAAFGAPYGPCGVDRREPSFAPTTYWRGPAWPQLTYLLWCAARARGLDAVAEQLGDALVAGALTSGMAEHWHPDTGEGAGAVPQSWTALAAVV